MLEKNIFLSVFLFLLTVLTVQAQVVRVAVAANAQFVIKALQADFKKKTGIETEAIIGSSGKLSTQIQNGAPYDIFLSADMDFPNSLFKNGFGISKPKVYAFGSLIVCSNSEPDLKNWKNLISEDKIKKIAIANPELAPYGKAAQQALQKYGLSTKINSKLVFGESIAQVNAYITTGAVDLGFTTEALIYENPDKNQLKWAKVDDKVYEKISQGMIVLNYARKGNLAKALRFYTYLSSPAAKVILKNNGYKVP